MDMSCTSLPVWLANFRNQLAEEHHQPVDLIETHISWLLLVGNFAYKIKKPVVFSFLDYGSAARRHFFCEEELRLNGRFAPNLYIDVVPVPGSDEWAVRMQRFDASARLDHLCVRGRLSPEQLSGLAQDIAGFQNAAPLAAPQSEFGDPERLIALANDNFPGLYRLLPKASALLGRIQHWTTETFSQQRGRMAARCVAGRIREGHGDLHLANLVLLDGKLLPFDCIEFNADLRWIDVASEVAFVYVDLLGHRRPELALWFVNEWLSCSGDYEAMSLFRFYAVYRAMVRASVAAIRKDVANAEVYLRVADELTQKPSPRLRITFGLSGSGKTWRSSRLILADTSASLIRVRSDVERHRLLGPNHPVPGSVPRYREIYTTEANSLVYACLANRTSDLLAAGWSVIVDATFLEHKRRVIFRALADYHRVPFCILACEAPIEDLRSRIRARQHDASDATVDVLEHQILCMEALAADEACLICDHLKDTQPENVENPMQA